MDYVHIMFPLCRHDVWKIHQLSTHKLHRKCHSFFFKIWNIDILQWYPAFLNTSSDQIVPKGHIKCSILIDLCAQFLCYWQKEFMSMSVLQFHIFLLLLFIITNTPRKYNRIEWVNDPTLILYYIVQYNTVKGHSVQMRSLFGFHRILYNQTYKARLKLFFSKCCH